MTPTQDALALADELEKLRELASGALAHRGECAKQRRLPGRDTRCLCGYPERYTAHSRLEALGFSRADKDYPLVPFVVAALRFKAKLDVIHASSEFQSVWTMAQNRGQEYRGPDYQEEFAALTEAALALAGGGDVSVPLTGPPRYSSTWNVFGSYAIVTCPRVRRMP